jgi:hypothetical protein
MLPSLIFPSITPRVNTACAVKLPSAAPQDDFAFDARGRAAPCGVVRLPARSTIRDRPLPAFSVDWPANIHRVAAERRRRENIASVHVR